jgi:hypothetical protein
LDVVVVPLVVVVPMLGTPLVVVVEPVVVPVVVPLLVPD